jgi:hydroxymethylpyrimidine pyrophosphatase-like HAD family hydrolase
MAEYMKERSAYGDARLTLTDDLEGTVADRGNRVVGLTVIDRSEAVFTLRERILDLLGGRLFVTFYEYRDFPGWHFLTLHDASATKRKAINFIRERFSLYGELVTFGDDDNDVEMVRSATLGVAVSNAKEPVKEVAGLVIGSNQEDSVMKYIRQHTRKAPRG